MNEKKRKTLNELNLLDRFLFDEVMEDSEVYAAVLEIIFGRDIFLKGQIQSEKEIRTIPSFRGIRLDVWGEDVDDSVYNSEMQKKDTKNLPRRSRYYQAALDTGMLAPGSIDFNALPDIYLIQIAPFDLFGQKRCMYTFRMQCEEEKELCLGDGAVRIFLNTKGTVTDGISEELVEFLHYVENSAPENAAASGSPRIRKIGRRVAAVKSNEVSEVKYMQLWEEKVMDRMEARAEGLAEGKTEGEALGKAEGILALLEDTCAVPEPLKDLIKNQSDPDILKQWLLAAKKAETIEDFIKRCGNISI